MTAFMSELTIRKDTSLRSILSLFDPNTADAGNRTHKLLWSAFPRQEGRRDFIYREIEAGRFIVVSGTAPQDNDLIKVGRSRPYDPAKSLKPGMELSFDMVVSPRRSIANTEVLGVRGKKVSLVKFARDTEQDLEPLFADWMKRQGEAHGFELIEVMEDDEDDFAVLGAEPLPMIQHVGRAQVRANLNQGAIEASGRLRVTDAEAFARMLLTGLGSLKAFGYGMMTVRR